MKKDVRQINTEVFKIILSGKFLKNILLALVEKKFFVFKFFEYLLEVKHIKILLNFRIIDDYSILNLVNAKDSDKLNEFIDILEKESVLSNYQEHLTEHENDDFVLYLTDTDEKFNTKHQIIEWKEFEKKWMTLNSCKIINISKNDFDNIVSYENFWEQVLKDILDFKHRWLIIQEPYLTGKGKKIENINAIIKILNPYEKILFYSNKDNRRKSDLQKSKLFEFSELIKNIHDRFIITPYFIIRSLHSFDYVDENNGKYIINHESTLILSSWLIDYKSFVISIKTFI